MSAAPTKILLADDHAITRDGLRAILEKEGKFAIVGEASNGREAVALAVELRPDIVLMDVSMTELGGIEATKKVVDRVPGAKVIALSMHSDRRYVAAMIAAGASAYVVKNSAALELLAAIDAVSRGDVYFGGAAGPEPLAEGPARGVAPRPLTAREREVLQLLAEGHSSKEIGARLSIALPTVETHRRQIMSKLGIRSVAELTKYAIREGLTPLEK